MQAALHGMQNILLIIDEENADHLPRLPMLDLLCVRGDIECT
jgi:hypothetical protein